MIPFASAQSHSHRKYTDTGKRNEHQERQQVKETVDHGCEYLPPRKNIVYETRMTVYRLFVHVLFQKGTKQYHHPERAESTLPRDLN